MDAHTRERLIELAARIQEKRSERNRLIAELSDLEAELDNLVQVEAAEEPVEVDADDVIGSVAAPAGASRVRQRSRS